MAVPVPRSNVELKARCTSLQGPYERVLALAAATPVHRLFDEQQTDTYFSVRFGRLKLREIVFLQPSDDGLGSVPNRLPSSPASLLVHPHDAPPPSAAQLIWYDRPDRRESKTSSYQLLPVPNPAELKRLLQSADGIQVEVIKYRRIFLVDQVRIHLDLVETLGTFLEFEAIVEPEATIRSAEQRVEKLRQHFGIQESDLLSGSYSDLLRKPA